MISSYQARFRAAGDDLFEQLPRQTVGCTGYDRSLCPWQGREPSSIAADATYGNGEFLHWLLERGVTPWMRTRDSALRKKSPFYGPERFTYLPAANSYLCPAGEQLNYVGLNERNRAHVYIGSAKRCGACSQKAQCTSGRYKYLAIHMHESARERTRQLAATPGFADAQRQRKKVEALFAELKNQDRNAPLAFASHEVCTRAVLPGSCSPKYQTVSSLPEQSAGPRRCCNCLIDRVETNQKPKPDTSRQVLCLSRRVFQQPQVITQVIASFDLGRPCTIHSHKSPSFNRLPGGRTLTSICATAV